MSKTEILSINNYENEEIMSLNGKTDCNFYFQKELIRNFKFDVTKIEYSTEYNSEYINLLREVNQILRENKENKKIIFLFSFFCGRDSTTSYSQCSTSTIEYLANEVRIFNSNTSLFKFELSLTNELRVSVHAIVDFIDDYSKLNDLEYINFNESSKRFFKEYSIMQLNEEILECLSKPNKLNQSSKANYEEFSSSNISIMNFQYSESIKEGTRMILLDLLIKVREDVVVDTRSKESSNDLERNISRLGPNGGRGRGRGRGRGGRGLGQA